MCSIVDREGARAVGLQAGAQWCLRRTNQHHEGGLSPKAAEIIQFTPTYSSWLNQVERSFALITERAIRRNSFMARPAASCCLGSQEEPTRLSHASRR